MGTTNPPVTGGQLRRDEPQVPQSAQAVIDELRARARLARNDAIDTAIGPGLEDDLVFERAGGRSGAFCEVLVWLDELSGNQAVKAEPRSEA